MNFLSINTKLLLPLAINGPKRWELLNKCNEDDFCGSQVLRRILQIEIGVDRPFAKPALSVAQDTN